MMRPLAFLFLLHLPCHGLGFASGVKIGEVTPTSAVLWTRLSENSEATNQTEKWTKESPNWTVPGAAGKVRFIYRPQDTPTSTSAETPWVQVGGSSDFCHQARIEGLKPATTYQFQAQGEDSSEQVAFSGTFTTAPEPITDTSITFTVSTCQEFELRDDIDQGHKIYHSMLKLEPAFFVQTGDTLYYDRKEPLSKNMPLARYRWGRMYSLPFQRKFHATIPSYWMHDDHDLLKNDCWPGQTYGELTWEQGLKIWAEQIPQSEKPYRTFRWGKDLQIWLPEGREFRSPNNMPDGPEKSILGKEQWAWLEKSMLESDATFKLFISATPVVGPDRGGKNDNHANDGFEYEGKRLRKLLNSVEGCFVINGDRHWQYHSIDSVTGLNEFGCGAASDKHAGGWNPKNKLPEHQFLRVKGGFVSVKIDDKTATLTHRDVDGNPTYSTEIKVGEAK